MEIIINQIKDLGLNRLVVDALPTAVVGGTWEGSFDNPIAAADYQILLNHIVPTGHQLKVLFMRVWTQETTGARFGIYQTNPAALGLTGAVEAYPVQGSVPPFTDGLAAYRDYPFLEAPGAEVLRGGLRDPVHVLEGSVEFRLLGPTPNPATGARYSFVWWGVEETPES
jgi:hypothetical protein